MRAGVVCPEHDGAEAYPDCVSCGYIAAALAAGGAMLAPVHAPHAAAVRIEAAPRG